MKWLAILLLFVNLGLYLWASGKPGQVVNVERIAKPTVDENGMQLLKEVELPSGSVCYRIGAFRKQESIEQTRQILTSFAIEHRVLTEPGRKVRVYRVYLGPFSSDAALDKARDRLESRQIEQFSMSLQDGTSILSLGLFSQQGSAEVFSDQLHAIVPESTIRPELRTLDPLHWVVINTSGNEGIEQRLKPIAWAEPSAKLNPVTCL